jgi:hypothetical protein
MKKTMMMLAATVFSLASLAQHEEQRIPQENKYEDEQEMSRAEEFGYRNGEWRDDRSGNRYDNRFGDRHSRFYFFSKREREMQIAQINREYDYRINAVRTRYHMNWYKKERIIRELEEKRRDEVKQVYAKFFDRRNQYLRRDREWERERYPYHPGRRHF